MSPAKAKKKTPTRKSSQDNEKGAKVYSFEAAAESRDFAQKYKVLFDQASDAIMTVYDDGKIDEANLAFQEMSGFIIKELAGKPVSDLSPDQKKNHVPERSRPLSRDMLSRPGTYEDIAVLRKDGFVRLVDLHVREVKSGRSKLSLCLFRDVTEKKRMERELITKHAELRNAYLTVEKNNLELKAMQDTLVQSGKMAALGELAAGIAHELNQPLMGIRGYAQEIRDASAEKLEGAPEVAAGLKEIISNADKMAKIIKYLRTFTRKSLEDFEMADVHFAIEEALKMLGRQFESRGIQVHREFDQKLSKVYAVPLQLEQVIINLATNARDAIEATGRGSGNIWIETREDKDFIEIHFKDDGCGIDDRVKSKVFNPFFTTKEVGKGMGLGLSLSYGILNKIHGSIFVESGVGKGTQFRIRLPRDFREMG